MFNEKLSNSMRKFGRTFAVAAGMAASALIAMPQLKASEAVKEVRMTFSAPVEISGRVLPAGTYIFRQPNNLQNVFIVTNADETKMYGTVMTLPKTEAIMSDLTGVPDKVHVDFAERRSDAPQALQAWTYPGLATGYEMVYPEGVAGTR